MPYQLQEFQNRLNRVRQDLNNITQAAAQLQQAEQQAQSQLARLSQQESLNTQQLQRIYQISINLQNEVNAISSAAQQFNVQAAGYGQFGTAGYRAPYQAPQTGTTGFTAGVQTAPYAGYTGAAGVSPGAGYAGTAGVSPAAVNVGEQAFATPQFTSPAPGAGTGAVQGGAQAYRPWPDDT
ncbi:MAG TPA: hypothetical protein EYP63_00100 [Desulfotomaculum sp.]|nr:hypothetical protein [Desulfotomaculum sp.]